MFIVVAFYVCIEWSYSLDCGWVLGGLGNEIDACPLNCVEVEEQSNWIVCLLLLM